MRLIELFNGTDPAQMAQELAQSRSTIERLQSDYDILQEVVQPLKVSEEKARTDMILLQHDQAHYQDTIKLKDQEIAFLQAHIAQLTQSISQLSLKPGEEEIKKKRWWQFWR